MAIYKLDKLDHMSGLSYQPGYDHAQNGASASPESLYFASLAGAEAHLKKTASVDPTQVRDNGSFRVYQSHVGQFKLTLIELHEDAPSEQKAE